MKDLIDTTEMYLKTIVELEEQGIRPLRARIAERLEHSGPTVSQTVARMERDKLLIVDSDRSLELTPEGRRIATSVMRKHRLAERLLYDVIGLDWELVHEEACRWEHVMSRQVEERLLAILPSHLTSPYGNPIPGLDELAANAKGATDAEDTQQETVQKTVPLTEVVVADKEVDIKIAWLGEPLQVDTFLLGQFKRTGVLPGAVATVRMNGEYLTVTVEGEPEVLDLPPETAENVFVIEL